MRGKAARKGRNRSGLAVATRQFRDLPLAWADFLRLRLAGRIGGMGPLVDDFVTPRWGATDEKTKSHEEGGGQAR
jgi:hypothetical protein